MNCDYKDKIVSYIENELNESDKLDFESELQKNSQLKEEYLEIKGLLNSLSNLPKLEASSDFIVSLNNKIDEYELKKERGLNGFINNILTGNYLPRISVVAMSFVFMLSLIYFWDSNLSNSSLILSNSSSTANESVSNEVAGLDSLEERLDIIDE